MTKISQLSDIGGSLAANDEFIIRDVSDASTPNKKVTASGFFNVATALGFTRLDLVRAGVSGEAEIQVFASGVLGRSDTTISGIVSARTTISGYFEKTGGVFFPVVTQTDIGTDPNQVPVCGMLGSMAFEDSSLYSYFACRAWVNFNGVGTVAIRANGNVSSVTDNGIGSYTVNFITAQPDANYAAITDAASVTASRASTYLTGSVSVLTYDAGVVDSTTVSVAIFR